MRAMESQRRNSFRLSHGPDLAFSLASIAKTLRSGDFPTPQSIVTGPHLAKIPWRLSVLMANRPDSQLNGGASVQEQFRDSLVETMRPYLKEGTISGIESLLTHELAYTRSKTHSLTDPKLPHTAEQPIQQFIIKSDQREHGFYCKPIAPSGDTATPNRAYDHLMSVAEALDKPGVDSLSHLYITLSDRVLRSEVVAYPYHDHHLLHPMQHPVFRRLAEHAQPEHLAPKLVTATRAIGKGTLSVTLRSSFS